MLYPEILQPIQCPEAFGQDTPDAVQSQAALLTALGTQLRHESYPSYEEFPLPVLVGPITPLPSTQRFFAGRLQAQLIREYSAGIIEAAQGDITLETSSEARYILAEQLYREPTIEHTALLVEACLFHPDELVRVAAAATAFSLRLEPKRLRDILRMGTYSSDELVQQMAATALSRFAPDEPRLYDLQSGPTTFTSAPPSHTSLIIHGTFARSFTWWQPSGDFHDHVLNNVDSTLYSASDRFDWSGGYSDAARLQAAQELCIWINTHNHHGLNIFAHSHGGSVAMLSNQAGMYIEELVLLSCPVHPMKYMPDFTNIGKVVSFHVRMDPVIMLDGGSQQFSDPNINEHVLPVWFNHSATHDPAVWITHGMEAYL